MRIGIRTPRIVYGPENEGGSGGNAPANSTNVTPPASGVAGDPPPAAPALPWGGVNDTWQIDGKPWYDVVVPEGPSRELARAKNYANPTVQADAYYNLNKTFNAGDSAVVIPKADAAPEVWNDFHKKMGRPDAA